MRAQEGGLVGELTGHGQAAGLVVDGEPVAALDLDGGRALAAHLAHQRRDVARQLLVGRGPGRGHGGADAAGGVRRPGHPGGELGSPVAGEDEVGVGVHETRDDRPASRVDKDVGGRCIGGGTDPGDPAAVDDERGPLHDAEQVVGVGIVGDELGDVGDDGAGHLAFPSRAAMAAASSRPISARSSARKTTRPPTMVWTTSSAEAAKTAVCSSAPVPAVRGVSVARVTRSARCPTAMAPASGKPRLA